MNHYAAAGLLTFCVSLVIAFIVYFKSPKRAANKFFALFSITVALYGFGFFKQAVASTSAHEMLAIRINLFGTIFVPIFFLRSIYCLLEKKLSFKSLALIYGTGILFEVVNFSTDWFAKDPIPRLGFSYLFQAGFLYPAMAFGFVLCIAFCLVNLFKGYRRSSGLRRNQLKYLFWAALIGFSGGSAGFALGYDVNLYPFNPFGAYFVFVGNILLAYAIVTYRLMDITFAVRDTTIRLASSLIPAAIFVAIGMAFFSPSVMIAMIVLTAIASPFLHGPLRRILMPVILGSKYDYQKLLRESTKSLVTMLDLRQLLNYIVNTISETVGVEEISLFLKEEGKRKYEIKASYGLDEELIYSYVLKPNEGIIPWLKQSKTVFIKEEMERALPGKAFENIYGDMGKIGAEFILPLFYKDNLVGVLNLSSKQSGGIYNQTDIDILESLGAEAAVAIENARLHTEVITDELTDLYQPRYFELRLREEIEKAKRYKHCLSLMMVEIDNFEEFKNVKEKRDKLLKGMAGIISANLRMGDIACLCRENGFGIILPEITEESGGNIRERLKKQIRETVEIGERLRRRVKEGELGVTVSIGIASFDGQDREMKRELMIKQAKEALTLAKREGNTVKVFYDEKLRKEISTEVLEWIKETEETLVSGDLCVDLTKHTVEVKGKPVKLTPKGFDLLCLLMKKKGRVLNRSFLTESIWGYEYFGTTRTVDSHIKSLRQKLGAGGKKIETIKGVGYKFVDEASII